MHKTWNKYGTHLSTQYRNKWMRVKHLQKLYFHTSYSTFLWPPCKDTSVWSQRAFSYDSAISFFNRWTKQLEQMMTSLTICVDTPLVQFRRWTSISMFTTFSGKATRCTRVKYMHRTKHQAAVTTTLTLFRKLVLLIRHLKQVKQSYTNKMNFISNISVSNIFFCRPQRPWPMYQQQRSPPPSSQS